ncbi:MAG TPA: FAD-binding protein [Bellilinea sp.]|jgi:fumarate reductase flavoprotein subunit|nr:FAD-binding protein [Bellilinea sp.]
MSSNISRRDFLKNAAVGSASIGVLGLAGCAPRTVSEDPTAAPAAEVKSTEGLPDVLTAAEFEESTVELAPITTFAGEVKADIVVVGAGASGVVAAITAAEEGSSVAVLQKQDKVVSQGNCGSGLVLDESDPEGLLRYVHQTNSLNNWRSNSELIKAYVMNSGEAVKWVYDRARLTGTTAENPNDKGLFAYLDTSQDFTGVWTDGRYNTFDYGTAKAHMYAPWMGPKPNNVGTFLGYMLEEAETEFGGKLKVYYSTPGVQLIKDGDKVVGVVGKQADGSYVKFTANKAVILATGDYQNNHAMVKRWCPDVQDFDKKQFQKTGDGHLMAVTAGAVMENLGHTKMLHDFDAGLMYEEPFLYVNMKGQRFCNEFVGFVYMNDIMCHQDFYKGGKNYEDAEKGSKGWYCQIYDSAYMDHEGFNALVPPTVMEKYMPEISDDDYAASHDGKPRTGVFSYLIDTWRADTLDELADKLGIEDKAAFLASVERYNELCDKGADEDFGKDAKWMNAIKTAPFYGIRRHLRVSALCSGVYTTPNGEALDGNNAPIPGLYCVGNLGGQFYGGADYPFHATGLSLGRCYTFGRIAGKHANTLAGGTGTVEESGTISA